MGESKTNDFSQAIWRYIQSAFVNENSDVWSEGYKVIDVN